MIAIQASTADFNCFTLLILGSRTPALIWSTTFPFDKSNPKFLKFLYLASVSAADWLRECLERKLATRSEESLAALTARVFGITRRAEANSAIASCSREPYRN